MNTNLNGKKLLFVVLATVILSTLAAAKLAADRQARVTNPPDNSLAFKITSPGFSEEGDISYMYTCDDTNVNPPLVIESTPQDAQSLALIVEDPDAPSKTWVHWVVFNIDPEVKLISKNSVPLNSVQGKNDSGKNSYVGPCPPSGTHRYFFRLYALKSMLNLAEGADINAVKSEIAKNLLAETQLVGTYQKSGQSNKTAECKITGCNSELCVDASAGEIASICIFKEEFACYKDAKCEKQEDGTCGWTQTTELTECLKGPGSSARP